MELVYAKIDPTTASKEEIQTEISRLQQRQNDCGNEEQAIKIFINSIYGATASPYFVGFNIKVAEAITLQGQDMIKYATNILNRYFMEFWHKDVEAHQALGITTPVNKVSQEVVIYGDTDSTYVSFEDVLASCKWKGEGIGFILALYKFRLEGYITNCFKKYGDKYHTDDIQKLELEKISESSIILAKKKYVLDLVWKESGVRYKPQSKINSKGVEIVQSSTPSFARTQLNELLKTLFREKKSLDIKKFVSQLKDIKEQFKLCDIEDVSKSTSISEYQKYISQDQEKLVILPRCPIHVRAAGVYNYRLNNSKFKRKYRLIGPGDKVRWYFTKRENGVGQDVFAFQPGNFPYEHAPEIDYDQQFAKTIIEPINRFIIAMGYGAIPANLITSARLF
jgi:DNA polymerase elongation subunit (family B)